MLTAGVDNMRFGIAQLTSIFCFFLCHDPVDPDNDVIWTAGHGCGQW
jgi:hypothetical protein